MLKIGLTGGLGSGKTTVARMFAELGAHILSADEIARDLMQPGSEVFRRIVEKFGQGVIAADGTLDRPRLAGLAFSGGMVEELNRIVHPATITRQEQMADALFAANPHSVVIVESALIFETKHSRGWRLRFDKMILVRATEESKIARFVQRSGGQNVEELEAEARRRLGRMIPDDQKAAMCDFVVMNDGTLERLRLQVGKIWAKLMV